MVKSLIVKSPLFSFVIINYLISWVFLYPSYQLVLNAEEGTFPPLALIGLIGAYGPSIAALTVKGALAGKSGVKKLLKKLLVWRVHFGWYFFIFLVPVCFYGLAAWTSSLFGFELGAAKFEEGLTSVFYFLMLALPFGPMGEELGWRGFMLPRLLEKYNAWQSSLILGFVWAFWHLVSFTFPGAAIPSVFEVTAWTLFLYLLSITADTLLMTYIFLKTKGSVLIAILFHTASNASSNIIFTIFPQIENNVGQREFIYIANIIFIALLSCILLLKGFKGRQPANES